MATGSITSTGLGSGLNIEGLVTKLMSVEAQPVTLLQKQGASYETKLSAWSKISASLSSLQVAANALNTRSNFAAYTGTVADTSIASLTTTSSAVAGTYSLEVTQLADVQKVKSSSGYAATTSTFTSDITSTNTSATLTLEVGTTANGAFTASTTKAITIDSSNNTLAGVRDAINNANIGVSATLVNDGSSTPYRLVLTSTSTGTANSFKLSGLSDFTFDPATATGTGTTQIQAAADAKYSIDGISSTKSSNTITDAIQGATLTLTKTNTGSPTKITVATDASAIETKIKSFVSAYNSLQSQIKTLTSYDSTTKASGDLNGDQAVRSVITQIKSVMSSVVSSTTGSANKLADAGITFQKDGTLSFNTTTFETALKDSTKDVAGVFVKTTTSTGIASKISSTITDMLGTNGLVTTRNNSLNKSISNVSDRIDVLNTRLTKIEATYRAQFTAMDTTIAKLNATSSYLTQQFAAMSKSS